MKNIKTFEGFFNYLYKDIKKKSTDILYNRIYPGTEETITFFDRHSMEQETEKEKGILSKYRKFKNVDIMKFNDEWFSVMIYLNRSPVGTMYFKCDTIEGVIQCLDDNKQFFKQNILGD
jgi:hypothetical protein